MIIRDYNGTGIWSADEIIRRYRDYAQQIGITSPRDIKPYTSEYKDTHWIYPVMHEIIESIQAGDIACAQIGIEFICEDQGFVFGLSLKSRTARVLKQFDGLMPNQIATIRKRIVEMYLTGTVPREYQSYLRLLRKIGINEYWPAVERAVPKSLNAVRARHYIFQHCARP